MDRKSRNGIAWLFVIAIMFVTAIACHAQDGTITAQTKGDLTLTPHALAAIHDAARAGAHEGATSGGTAVVRVPDMKAMQGLIDANGELQKHAGYLEDENNKVSVENLNLRHQLAEREAPNKAMGSTPWWWWLPLLLSGIALFVAAFNQGRQGRDGLDGKSGLNGKDGKDAVLDLDLIRQLVDRALTDPKTLSALAFALKPLLDCNGTTGAVGPQGPNGDPGLSETDVRRIVAEELDVEQPIVDDGTTVVRIGNVNVSGGTVNIASTKA